MSSPAPLALASARRRRLLWYGDAPTAATGFGTVSRNVLASLSASGWDVVVRGVNYYGQGHPYPYMMLPAGYPDGDPFGKKNILRDLTTGAFDLLIVNNDTYVLAEIATELRRVCSQTGTRSILYYPVDLKLIPQMADVVRAFDQPVAYSRFGLAETLKLIPGAPIAVIPHGCDSFPPISADQRREYRGSLFGINDDTFLWMNCNRNSMRKDLAHSIEAFSLFRDYQPDSRLYLHCQAQDNGLDLMLAAADCGVSDAVAFPNEYSLANGGIPRERLQVIYQLADGFLTTHLGEGWGLTVTEAMAAGLPVVAPNNTTMPEILGTDYPYLYPCTERVWIDNTGMRPRGTTRAVYEAMRRVAVDREQAIVDHAAGRIPEAHVSRAASLAFAREHAWESVGKMWLQLVDHVMGVDYQAQRAAATPAVDTL